jgi:hypothetical protein
LYLCIVKICFIHALFILPELSTQSFPAVLLCSVVSAQGQFLLCIVADLQVSVDRLKGRPHVHWISGIPPRYLCKWHSQWVQIISRNCSRLSHAACLSGWMEPACEKDDSSLEATTSIVET